MELLLFHVLMWGETQNTIRIVTESLRFIKGKELEEGAFVSFKFGFLLNSVQTFTLEWLNTGIILPDETLKFGRTISQFGRGLGENLVRVGFMHIVSHCLASLVHLISLNETSGKWVVFLKLVISCSFVIAKNTGDSKVLTTGIEDDSSWLTLW